MIFGMRNPLKSVATLPWEIQNVILQQYSSTILIIYVMNKMHCNCHCQH